MVFTVLITLYTTRLVLSSLGISDFGLYNLIGGAISLLGFLSGSMAASTQRFLSFANGSGDFNKVGRIFNMSILLHWIISILVIFILELVGILFFSQFFNIAHDRIYAAKLIYQFMVISTFFTVISVPYEAILTSRENMFAYSIFSLIEVVLKLFVAIYVSNSLGDHLIIYGLLITFISIFLMVIKRIYCIKLYKECHLDFRLNYDKPLLKEMTSFAGWSFLGSFSSIITAYSQGIILNSFFGTVVNAAQGIAAQVSGQLGVFSNTMLKALNPMIDKSAGSGDFELSLRASYTGTKISFFLLMITILPVSIEMPFIFDYWLDIIPENTILFCRLLLIRKLIEACYVTFITTIGSFGNIKYFQIISSLNNFFPIVICYIIFVNNFPSYFLYIIYIFYALLQAVIVIYFAKVNCGLEINSYLKRIIFPCWLILLIVFSISHLPNYFLESNLLRSILVFAISLISSTMAIWILGLSREEKLSFIIFSKNLIKKKIWRSS